MRSLYNNAALWIFLLIPAPFAWGNSSDFFFDSRSIFIENLLTPNSASQVLDELIELAEFKSPYTFVSRVRKVRQLYSHRHSNRFDQQVKKLVAELELRIQFTYKIDVHLQIATELGIVASSLTPTMISTLGNTIRSRQFENNPDTLQRAILIADWLHRYGFDSDHLYETLKELENSKQCRQSPMCQMKTGEAHEKRITFTSRTNY